MPKKPLKKNTTQRIPPDILPFVQKMAKENNGRFIITDKGTKRTYYGTLNPDGSFDVNSYEVLTGKNDNPQAGKKINPDLPLSVLDKQIESGNIENAITPLGSYKPKLQPAYGHPGLNYIPSNKNSATYTHITYPGDLKKREPLYENKSLKDNAASYGCINGRCGDIKNMVEFFRDGDLAYIVDTRLPLQENMKVLETNKYYKHPLPNDPTPIPQLQNKKTLPKRNLIQSPSVEQTEPPLQKPKQYTPIDIQSKSPVINYSSTNSEVGLPPDRTVELTSMGINPTVFDIPTHTPTIDPILNKSKTSVSGWNAQKLPSTLGGGVENPGGNSYVPSIEDVAAQKAKDLSMTMKSIGLDPNIFDFAPARTSLNTVTPIVNPLSTINTPTTNVSVVNNQDDLKTITTPVAINTPPKLNYNPDGSMVLNKNWDMKSQQVPFQTPSINKIPVAPNQENIDFEQDPNNFVPKTNTTQSKTTYNPYQGLVNIFDFGLNSLTNLKNRSVDSKNELINSQIGQQPETTYYNKRQLRGDKVMFAKQGGEYKEGGEYEFTDEELQNLKKLGYEFEIL